MQINVFSYFHTIIKLVGVNVAVSLHYYVNGSWSTGQFHAWGFLTVSHRQCWSISSCVYVFCLVIVLLYTFSPTTIWSQKKARSLLSHGIGLSTIRCVYVCLFVCLCVCVLCVCVYVMCVRVRISICICVSMSCMYVWFAYVSVCLSVMCSVAIVCVYIVLQSTLVN